VQSPPQQSLLVVQPAPNPRQLPPVAPAPPNTVGSSDASTAPPPPAPKPWASSAAAVASAPRPPSPAPIELLLPPHPAVHAQRPATASVESVCRLLIVPYVASKGGACAGSRTFPGSRRGPPGRSAHRVVARV